MKTNLKKIIIIIILTILIGSFFSFFVSMDIYNVLKKPNLSPPLYVFPIAWIIIYIMISISLYLVTNTKKNGNFDYYMIYVIQLIVNSLCTFIFFGLECFLFSFFWILLLIILVLFMTCIYYQNNKYSAYLLIPYICWLIFAAYLNLQIYLLN